MKHTLLAFFVLILLTGCGLKTTTIEEQYNGNLDKVSKIEILDGNTGEIVSTKDKKQIQAFITEIKGVEFIPDEDQSKRDGFNYSVTFYQDDDKKFQFSLTQLEDNYYHTDPDIKPTIEQFYESIKSK